MREAQNTHTRTCLARPGSDRLVPVRRRSPVAPACRPEGIPSLPGGSHSFTARLRAALLLALAVVALLALALPSSAGAQSPYEWLGLAGGKVGEFEWSVKVKRPEATPPTGIDGARRPCLLVGTKWQMGSFSFRRSRYRTCADASDGIRPKAPPLIASGIQPGAAPKGMTAIGMLVSPAVRRVWVQLSNGRRTTVRLRRMSPKQARAARIRRYRYAAFAVRGEWCAERTITYDGRGRPLYDSGPDTVGCGIF